MKTAVAADTPDGHQSLAWALYALLHKRNRATAYGPNQYPWHELHGFVQIRLAVWDRQRGWLTTRPGFSHGPYPDMDGPDLEERTSFWLKTSIRVLRHRW